MIHKRRSAWGFATEADVLDSFHVGFPQFSNHFTNSAAELAFIYAPKRGG